MRPARLPHLGAGGALGARALPGRRLRGEPAPRAVTGEPTRRFDEQMTESYPSVFVPPAYQPPRAPQPFTTFGAGPHQPPATTAAPPPGPASPYANPHQSYTGPTH